MYWMNWKKYKKKYKTVRKNSYIKINIVNNAQKLLNIKFDRLIKEFYNHDYKSNTV